MSADEYVPMMNIHALLIEDVQAVADVEGSTDEEERSYGEHDSKIDGIIQVEVSQQQDH